MAVLRQDPDVASHSTPTASLTAVSIARAGTSSTSISTAGTSTEPPPVAVDETAMTTQNAPLTLTSNQLLANDTAPAGQTLSLTGVSSPQHGTVAFDAAHGTVTFTPASGFTGDAGFQYQIADTHGETAHAHVTVTVAPAAQPPISATAAAAHAVVVQAVGPAAAQGQVQVVPPAPPSAGNPTVAVPENLSSTVPAVEILAYDKASVPNDPLHVAAVSTGHNGSVSLTSNGDALFTPREGYLGAASFGYTVADAFGSTAQGQVSVNVVPFVQPEATSPLAFKTAFDTPLAFNASQLLGESYSPIWTVPGTAQVLDHTVNLSNASHGRVSLDGPSGQIVFTPDHGFAGKAAFDWSPNDVITGGGPVQVDVAPPPAPTAVTDTLSGSENTAMVIPAQQLLANDQASVPADDPLHIAAVSAAQHASVSLTSHGDVNFTPDSGFAGVATFAYMVADQFGQSANGTVAVNVQAPPSPPPSPPLAPPPVHETQVIQQTQHVEITQVQQVSVAPTVIVQQPPSNIVSAVSHPAPSVQPTSAPTPTPPPPAAVVYFDGTSQAHGSELWSFNGQTVGEVADINPGSPSSFPANLQAIDTTLYFSADDGTHGRQPWTFDGQHARMLADINPDGSSDPRDFTQVVGSTLPTTSHVYFSADDGTHGRELWVADPNRGVHMVGDINPGSAGSNPANLTALDGTLYFTADDGTHGTELWKVGGDGNPSQLADLNPGSASSTPDDLTVVGHTLYFLASDGTHGRELFSVASNGQIVEQLFNPGATGAFPAAGSDHALLSVGDKLYFVTNSPGQGTMLWSESEGSTAARPLGSLGGGPNASLASVQAATAGHDLYFATTDGLGNSQLARYDLNTGNLTSNIAPDAQSAPADLTPVGNQIFFTVLNHTAIGDVQFRDLYTDNGQTTQKVELGSQQTLPHNLVAANGLLFFADHGQLEEINPQTPPLAATTLTVAGGQIYVPIDITAASHESPLIG